MVDIVSGAGGVRTIRRVSESFRLHLPHYTKLQKDKRNAPGQGEDNGDMVGVRLEVQEDRDTGDIVYRLIDLKTGDLIHEWRGEHAEELRHFLQERGIQLVDQKV